MNLKMKNNIRPQQTTHSLPYCYNPKAKMKEVFKNIQIHLPKDDKFEHKFANSR